MANTFYINGVTAESLGLSVISVTSASGWADLAQKDFHPLNLPLRQGQIPVATGSTVAPRVFKLAFLVQPTSFADRNARLATIASALQGLLEIRSDENVGKLCYGYLTQGTVTAPYQLFVNTQIISEYQITCFDPLWYDANPIIVGGASAGNWLWFIPGGAPMRRIKFWLYGSATNPSVALRRRTNLFQIQSMSFTVTLGANDYLEVDCDAYTITRYTAGVASDAISTLSSTDSFLYIDEPIGNQLSNDGCILIATGATMTAAYYRAYWS